MGRRMLGGLTAAVLATVGAVTVVAPEPARADGVPCEYVVVCPPPGPTVSFGLTAMYYYKVWGEVGKATLESLVGELVGKIFEARQEVAQRADANMAAQSVSEAERFSTDFMNYDVMRESWSLYAWAGDVFQSASRDYAFLRGDFTDRKAADSIGWALNVKFPMALDAGRDAGMSQASLNQWNQEYIDANELIKTRLEPVCNTKSEVLAPPLNNTIQVTYTCTAADGNVATARELYLAGKLTTPQVDIYKLKVESAIYSSWLTAVDMLPSIRNPNP